MLQAQNISKSFSGVKALQDVSAVFEAGQVHVLCGENGAGKSTLMNIVAGNLQPDVGGLLWQGKEVQINNPQEAQKLGIALVHQERSLVASLSVAENIFPQNQPRSRWGFIHYKSLYRQTENLLQQLGMQSIGARTIVSSLSPAQQQMVEIAKALATAPSLLILDEPTASLTHNETAVLFRLIKDLRAKGVAIIYITHRMKEISEIGDVVSVLKDGTHQGTFPVAQITNEDLVRLMVGRALAATTYTSHATNQVALGVKNLSGPGFSGVSFNLHKGEVLGLAGLEGSGRTALARALFGDLPVQNGSIQKEEKLIFNHPADAVKNGFAYLPDDRKTSGLFLDKTVAENIAATHLQKGWYHSGANEELSKLFENKLAIKTPGSNQVVRKLSGGNQQKIVLAKWLSTAPDILLMNEPTHGVDVGAKSEIYSLINQLASEGKSILLISSDLPELLLLSDRIAVMHGGTLTGIINKEEATEESLTRLASGLNK